MDNVTAPSSTYIQGERTGEGDEQTHEKKPVLKKVKDKVKKIKNSIVKKSHQHGDEGEDVDHHQHGDLDEGDDGFVEDDDMMEDPEVHGAPMYESSAIGMRTGGKELSGGSGGEGLGSIKTEFVEDPAAPPNSEAETKTGAEYTHRGGEEAEVSPELHRSLEAMTISAQNDGQETEPIKGANNSYTGMVTSAASKVYEMVADAGTAVISKVKPDARKEGEGEAVGNQGKGLSVKEYITEKLTPGEDEKALSELITEAGQLRKNEEVEVPRQVGTGNDEGGRGAGVVERLKETVTSLLGGGEGSPKSAPATESSRKDSEDSLR